MSRGSMAVCLHVSHRSYPFYALEFCLRCHLRSVRIADIIDAEINILVQGLLSSFVPGLTCKTLEPDFHPELEQL